MFKLPSSVGISYICFILFCILIIKGSLLLIDSSLFWPISLAIKFMISYSAERKREKNIGSILVVHKYFLFCPCIKCAPLWVSQSPTGVPDVVLYLLSSACQILSISEMHKVGRTTTRTAPFAKHEPDSLLCESRGISYWQIEDFMAYTATLNSSVMKARRSITHLFVFLLLWITVSIADSSLEWNENKTIIHLVKLCRKGEKAMISFRSSALSLGWVIYTLGNEDRQLPGGEKGGFYLLGCKN